jgi:hypothetical protein
VTGRRLVNCLSVLAIMSHVGTERQKLPPNSGRSKNLFIHPEKGGRTFLRNVGTSNRYVMLIRKRTRHYLINNLHKNVNTIKVAVEVRIMSFNSYCLETRIFFARQWRSVYRLPFFFLLAVCGFCSHLSSAYPY